MSLYSINKLLNKEKVRQTIKMLWNNQKASFNVIYTFTHKHESSAASSGYDIWQK